MSSGRSSFFLPPTVGSSAVKRRRVTVMHLFAAHLPVSHIGSPRELSPAAKINSSNGHQSTLAAELTFCPPEFPFIA
uniref:Uncharacterized protein n=1 Tax=Timema poppense TaxID=170557 RepID=A0A7R9CZ80_TIMPO|nr:unnamed protein product [Timema poppensis]